MTFPDEMHKAGVNNNLTPITTVERARELGSKGGQVKSVGKSVSAKLREMKKRGVSGDDLQWLYELCENPDASFITLARTFHKIMNSVPPEQQAGLFDKYVTLYKIRHGTKETHSKHEIDMRSLNVEVKFIAPAEFSKKEVAEIESQQPAQNNI